MCQKKIKTVFLTGTFTLQELIKLKIKKENKNKNLIRHSNSYKTRQLGMTGQTDERIKVATWLQIYK